MAIEEVSGTCGTCKWWYDYDGNEPPCTRECNHPRFSGWDSQTNEDVPDILIAGGAFNYEIIYTSPEFGCVLWEGR